MSLSTPFIHRPIATMLLTLGLALVGAVSYFLLPVAPLPQVDYPTISVSASLPGASPSPPPSPRHSSGLWAPSPGSTKSPRAPSWAAPASPCSLI
mgnify:CR=1 FL=1